MGEVARWRSSGVEGIAVEMVDFEVMGELATCDSADESKKQKEATMKDTAEKSSCAGRAGRGRGRQVGSAGAQPLKPVQPRGSKEGGGNVALTGLSSLPTGQVKEGEESSAVPQHVSPLLHPPPAARPPGGSTAPPPDLCSPPNIFIKLEDLRKAHELHTKHKLKPKHKVVDT